MNRGDVEPIVSLGRREIPVPVWAVTLLNLVFFVAGVYVMTLGSPLAIGGGLVLSIMGASGLYSIASRGAA